MIKLYNNRLFSDIQGPEPYMDGLVTYSAVVKTPKCCPYCKSDRIGFKKKQSREIYAIVNSRPARLTLFFQYWRCKNKACNHYRYESFRRRLPQTIEDEISGNKKYTDEFLTWIVCQIAEQKESPWKVEKKLEDIVSPNTLKKKTSAVIKKLSSMKRSVQLFPFLVLFSFRYENQFLCFICGIRRADDLPDEVFLLDILSTYSAQAIEKFLDNVTEYRKSMLPTVDRIQFDLYFHILKKIRAFYQSVRPSDFKKIDFPIFIDINRLAQNMLSDAKNIKGPDKKRIVSAVKEINKNVLGVSKSSKYRGFFDPMTELERIVTDSNLSHNTDFLNMTDFLKEMYYAIIADASHPSVKKQCAQLNDILAIIAASAKQRIRLDSLYYRLLFQYNNMFKNRAYAALNLPTLAEKRSKEIFNLKSNELVFDNVTARADSDHSWYMPSIPNFAMPVKELKKHIGTGWSEKKHALLQSQGIDYPSKETSSIHDDLILFEAYDWQQRPLQRLYLLLTLDELSFRDFPQDAENAGKQKVFVVTGLGWNGLKDVLGIWIEEDKQKINRQSGIPEADKDIFYTTGWNNVLQNLKSRGVQDVFMACTNHPEKISDVLSKYYPQARLQISIPNYLQRLLRIIAEELKYNSINPAEVRDIFNPAKVRDIFYFIIHYPVPDTNAILSELYDTLPERYWYDLCEDWEYFSPCYCVSPDLRKLIYSTNISRNIITAIRTVVAEMSPDIDFSSDYLLKRIFIEIMGLPDPKIPQGWDELADEVAAILRKEGRI